MAGDTAESSGALPFDEWMRRALFDPERGYYARQIGTVGRRGDFTTTAGASDALGEAVAGWLKEERRNAPDVRAVIEVGGGTGALMRAVRRALGFFGRRRMDFLMVESSPVLREQQQKALPGASVKWIDSMEAALDACGGRAFIFHNELLDAFPVMLAEWDGTEWRELWLARRGERWVEEFRGLRADDRRRGDFSALGVWPVAAGQRVELGGAALDWMRGWAPQWRGGAMLTIDYGDVFPGIYRRQPRGTLRAYLRHHRLTGPEVYGNMGRQDITADVNFTDIIRCGEALGWETARLETQREFLGRHLPDLESRMGRDAVLRFVADEHGAGASFKALVQRAR